MVESLSLSYIYKVCVHDVSNVHMKSMYFCHAQSFQMSRGAVVQPSAFSFGIVVSQSILFLFIGHHTLVFSLDTRVASTKVFFGV